MESRAINHACYFLNPSLSRMLGFIYVNQVWSNKPVSLSALMVFRCTAYMFLFPLMSGPNLIPNLLNAFPNFQKGVKGYKL